MFFYHSAIWLSGIWEGGFGLAGKEERVSSVWSGAGDKLGREGVWMGEGGRVHEVEHRVGGGEQVRAGSARKKRDVEREKKK